MIGKSDVPNRSVFLFFLDPVSDPDLYKLFPGFAVVEHMHQVIVNIIGLQSLQLFLKLFFCPRLCFYKVMRQLGCQTDLLPAVVFCQDLADCLLVAWINIGGIQVIDSMADAVHQLLLCLIKIDR